MKEKLKLVKENTFLVTEEDLLKILVREFDLPECTTFTHIAKDIITNKYHVLLDIKCGN